MRPPSPERPAAAVPAGTSEDATDTAQGASLRVFLLASAGFVVALVGALVVVLARQNGTFTYAIDDPMIHLALARNLARHGTFGLTPGVYESASSGPLWELLLAPVLAVAPNAWWLPLAVNIGAAAWLLRSFSRLPFLIDASQHALGRVLVVMLPVGIGLVPLVFTGMEHTLHAALVAQLLWWLVARSAGQWTRRTEILWYASIALGTLLRFETAFVAVGVAVAVFVVPRVAGRRRAPFAVGTIAAGILPYGVFGAVNLAFGQYLLPNSVAAKTGIGTGLPIPHLSDVVDRLAADPLLIVLAVAAGVLLWLTRHDVTAAARWRAPLVVLLVATALQVSFADIGWFDRYQAYLVVGFVLALFGALPAVVDHDVDWARWLTMAFLVLMFMRVATLVTLPGATYDTYGNQYQLGRFLAATYPGRAVAVNDIGYVSWDHDGGLVDIAGLGSFDFVEARKQGKLDAAFTAQELADHDVQVLAVYDAFFGGLVPPGWEEAGRWCTTSPRVVLSSDCVAFFAPAGAPVEDLRRSLAEYAPMLPPEVSSTIAG